MATDYTPSPELVEEMWQWPDLIPTALLERILAFRHPDGHPELVPFDEYTALLDDCITATERMQAEGDRVREQVRELVEAAKSAERRLADDAVNAMDWAPAAEQAFMEDLRSLRAALAPFTQEPKA